MLEGTKFEVWTDHKNLEYFMKAQNLNRRQAHWVLYLSKFNFTLKHVSETKMRKTDRLSRKPDWKVGVEKDNENQTLIKEQWIFSLVEVVIEGLEVDILKKLKTAREKNKKVVRVVEEMKKVGVEVLQGDEWQIEEDLVLKGEKIYVPNNKKLRVEIIWLYHDELVAGHGERWKMTEFMTWNHWWPGIMRDVGKYVDSCDMCQRMKNRTETLVGKLKLSEILKKS